MEQMHTRPEGDSAKVQARGVLLLSVGRLRGSGLTSGGLFAGQVAYYACLSLSNMQRSKQNLSQASPTQQHFQDYMVDVARSACWVFKAIE